MCLLLDYWFDFWPKFHRVQSECKFVEESSREFPKGKLLASQPFIVEPEVEKENCVAECRVNNKSIELCSLIMIHHLTLKTTTLTSWLHVCTQNKPSTSYSTVLNRNLYGSALTKSFYISYPKSYIYFYNTDEEAALSLFWVQSWNHVVRSRA